MLKKIYDILLIEDDPVTIEIVQDGLQRFNFHVFSVADGQLAVSRLRSTAYDAILCDIMLPHLDGLNVLERSKDSIATTPVVMLTALSDKQSVMRAHSAGAAGYLRKPFTIEQLVAKLMEACRLTKEDLIERRQFPFSFHVNREAGGTLTIKITGCPAGNPQKEISSRLHDAILRAPQIKRARIDVAAELAYDARGSEYLNTLGMLLQKAGIPRSDIEFCGPYFREQRVEIGEFRGNWNVKL